MKAFVLKAGHKIQIITNHLSLCEHKNATIFITNRFLPKHHMTCICHTLILSGCTAFFVNNHFFKCLLDNYNRINFLKNKFPCHYAHLPKYKFRNVYLCPFLPVLLILHILLALHSAVQLSS